MRLSSGKVGVTLILVVAFAIGIAVMAVTSAESPTTTASRFMSALADGEPEVLADLSFAEGVSREELAEQWTYTMKVVAPHFKFTYNIRGESSPTPDTAVVWMMYTKNAGTSGTYDERFELPMRKTEDGWKVEVYGISRSMFPGLPRG